MAASSDFFQRAVAALASGDFDRAEKLTRELLNQDEKNIEAWSLLTSIYQQGGKREKALEPAKRATELDPDNIQHWNTLGYLYLSLSRWEEGEKCYARAVTLSEAPATVFLNHAWALIELGQKEKAGQQLKLALEKSLEDELTNMIRTDPQYSKLRALLD